MPTTVVHVQDPGGYDVYIGRASRGRAASKWGNPFRMQSEADRSLVIAQYRAYILDRPDLLAALGELRGKRLGCYCAPKACHGDVLAELADAVTPNIEQSPARAPGGAET